MNFNLAEWALKHKSIIYFLMAVTFIMGIVSFERLGRMEDPDFTIRQMVVVAAWPGASAQQVTEQVTDKLERKIQDVPGLDYVKSYTEAGKTVIFVNLDESLPISSIRPTWRDVRSMISDEWSSLPSGVVGPTINDRFDDVYGTIYAITGDDYSYEEKRKIAEDIRRQLLSVPDVKKVELEGVQEEHIYVEINQNKLAQLQVDPQTILTLLKQQSAMEPSGMMDTDSSNVHLRVNGLFGTVESVKNLPINVGSSTIRLGDIATVRRDYATPQDALMYFNGKPAIGIALAMADGGNNLVLGENLDKHLSQIKENLPLGIEISQVSNQPKVVKDSIHEFTKSLFEAIIIVLFVSFISLGVRSGIVVALCIPMVVCATFISMYLANISLHIVSLGALIISLGLLVDDAIIVVEMMTVKLEEGMDRFHAASFAYKATAFPMLSGTLITCAGFMPVGLATGMVAEFTKTLFYVVGIALLLSWIASVMVSPVLGYELIKRVKPEKKSKFGQYTERFYVHFRQWLVWCLDQRKKVVATAAILFVISLCSFSLIKMDFFPASIRPEIIVDMTLPAGTSLANTKAETKKMSDLFYGDKRIESYSYYVGEGAPRFVLPFDPTLAKDYFAEFIVVANSVEERNDLYKDLGGTYSDKFPNARINLRYLQTGPPADYPVMLRVSGPDENKVISIAEQVRTQMEKRSDVQNISFDWPDRTATAKIHIDREKARLLNVDSYAVALDLQSKLSGSDVAEFYDGDRTIPITFRLDGKVTKDLQNLPNIPIHIGSGRYVPLSQIGTVSSSMEDGVIYRRNLQPTITVRANVVEGALGNTVTTETYKSLDTIQKNLPFGYQIKMDGSGEMSEKALKQLLVPMPAVIIFVLSVLIFQLRKIRLMLLAILTMPLGLIGVVAAMLLSGQPLGFVAILGIIALSGMIIRNAIILLDQIEQHLGGGATPWDAIIDSTLLRFRPIMLTAMAAILGMLPLMQSTFWRPMAIAFSGGLLVATIMTLLVLPCMYALCYKVKRAETVKEQIK